MKSFDIAGAQAALKAYQEMAAGLMAYTNDHVAAEVALQDANQKRLSALANLALVRSVVGALPRADEESVFRLDDVAGAAKVQGNVLWSGFVRDVYQRERLYNRPYYIVGGREVLSPEGKSPLPVPAQLLLAPADHKPEQGLLVMNTWVPEIQALEAAMAHESVVTWSPEDIHKHFDPETGKIKISGSRFSATYGRKYTRSRARELESGRRLGGAIDKSRYDSGWVCLQDGVAKIHSEQSGGLPDDDLRGFGVMARLVHLATVFDRADAMETALASAAEQIQGLPETSVLTAFVTGAND